MKKRWILPLLAVLANTGSSHSGIRISREAEPFLAAPAVSGARALGMGGITSVTSRGIDGLSGNPAGLCLEGPNLAVDFSFPFLVRSGYGESDVKFEDYTRLDFHDLSSSPPGMPRLAIAVPLIRTRPRPVLGLAFRHFYNWNFSREWTFRYVYSTFDTNIHEKFETRGLFNTFTSGLGLSLTPSWSAGVLFHVPVRPRLQIEHSQTSRNHQLPYNQQEWSEKYTIALSASSFWALGTIIRVKDRLALSLGFQTPHRIEFLLHDGWFTDRWKMPETVDFGLSVRPLKSLLIAAEIQSRPWHALTINGRHPESMPGGVSFRLGLEGGSRRFWRIGAARDPLPIDPDNDGKPVISRMITVGLGLRSSTFQLDMAGSLQWASYPDPDALNNGRYQMRQGRFLVSLTAGFPRRE
ncbi:MAG TPA: hypothetical protein ENN03_03770 [bacterium]|nr:hypothetical protein [bacterium]